MVVSAWLKIGAAFGVAALAAAFVPRLGDGSGEVPGLATLWIGVALGSLCTLLATVLGAYAAFYWIDRGDFPGPLLGGVAVLFVLGIQGFILALVGEYLGRIQRGVEGRPLFAISLTGPDGRFTLQRLESCVPEMLAAARALSAQFGGDMAPEAVA